MILRAFIISLSLVPLIAAAQLEEIVVTASRRTGHGEMPAVTVANTADFLVQNVRLVNDSRAPDLRRREIIETIQALMKQAARKRPVDYEKL